MSGDRTLVLPPELQGAKLATRSLIRAFGGQEAAAVECQKSQSRMSSYGHANTADFMPICDVRRLEAQTVGLPGHPHVTRWLADQADHLLIPKPRAIPSDVDWHGALGDAVAEFGDVTQRICRALPGGVTAEDIKDANIRREIAEAMQCLAVLDALAARAEEQG